MTRLAVATSALAALLLAAPAASRPDRLTTIELSGVVMLQAVDVTANCAFSPGVARTFVTKKVKKTVVRTVRGKKRKVKVTVNRRVPVTKPLLNARCGQIGAFEGQPAVAGAAYNWTWGLELKKNVTTGHGNEVGELGLNFGGPGILTLALKGRQAPVGTPTATSAQGETKGRWTVKSGTGSFAGLKGSGTYVFSTSRNSPTTFEVAKITLAGTLTS